jgi:uncharacterized protein YndB with AHSA1/START domain
VKLASYELTIAAPAEVVWAHLTTAEGLMRWVGPAATADPAPGGVLRDHGLPPEVVPDHEHGWAYFLGELRATLAAG